MKSNDLRVPENKVGAFKRFFGLESSPSIVLIVATILALVLANSDVTKEIYFSFLKTYVFGLSIHHWINDGLMTLFFFMVGLEIKKELTIGELSDPKKATLPIFAAVGGIVFPALIYLYFNPKLPEQAGWGIPMATDIAFALGTLAFFGNRIPSTLKIFLLALAIIDDLCAVMVIALFYTSSIQGAYLGLAALFIGATILAKTLKVASYYVYFLLGIIVWFGFLKSGVHATVAGVLLGLLTPVVFSRKTLPKFSPLEDLLHGIHGWSAYAIIPVFAFANAGVSLAGIEIGSVVGSSIFSGVFLGLVLGKPLGVILFSVVPIKLGWARLPGGCRWWDMVAVGFLAGIGFTMSLFISGLAMTPEQEIYSKSGILSASLIAATLGVLTLLLSNRSTSVRRVP